MPRCPECQATVSVTCLLCAPSQGGNFSRGAMRFRTRCSNCGASVGLEPGSVRLFLFAWLCPLILFAWITEIASPWLGLSLGLAGFFCALLFGCTAPRSLSQGNAKPESNQFAQMSARVTSPSVQNCRLSFELMPRPSLEPTRAGIALGPRGARSYHSPRGPSAIPTLAAQLKR